MLAMILFAPWYRYVSQSANQGIIAENSFRNAMNIEFADDLKLMLEEEGRDLQIQGTFLPGDDILAHYSNLCYGNAYDFDQQGRLEQEI